MSFINKPSKQLSDVASQYGLEDVYHEKIMSLIADKKQTLKRAIRSKDFETLLSFIPYDIPVVDSLFATSNADIAMNFSLLNSLKEQIKIPPNIVPNDHTNSLIAKALTLLLNLRFTNTGVKKAGADIKK